LKLSRIAIRALLKKNKKGVILITASMAGFHGNFPAALYCSTKHAIVGFVRSLADLDRLEGIKVVAVAPG
jgi:NAD(P)-dependent dehydrogenase (short-subunit alcohol dehydrogenase family)